jgi:hypothetical protein
MAASQLVRNGKQKKRCVGQYTTHELGREFGRLLRRLHSYHKCGLLPRPIMNAQIARRNRVHLEFYIFLRKKINNFGY